MYPFHCIITVKYIRKLGIKLNLFYSDSFYRFACSQMQLQLSFVLPINVLFLS